MTDAKRPGITIEARRVRADHAVGHPDDFTYTVMLEPARPQPASAERRHGSRRRTRLRSAKIVDAGGVFVTDCLVHDLSARGGRLRLPPGAAIPRSIQVYDDQTGQLHRAAVLWRRERDIGVLLEPPRDDPRARATAEALRRKYYAVRG